MSITSKSGSSNTEVVISVSGNFDHSTRNKFTLVYKKYPRGSKRFVVDFKETTYLDSAALGLLLELREYSCKNAVELVNGSESIREIFQIAYFYQLFTIR